MTTDKKPAKGTQCCARVRSGRYVRPHQCGKVAKVTRDGEPYCGIHDPEKIEERRKRRFERGMEEYDVWKQKKDAAEAARAELERRASCFDDLLGALEECVLQIEYLHGKYAETGSGNSVLARASAAIARAKEGK